MKDVLTTKLKVRTKEIKGQTYLVGVPIWREGTATQDGAKICLSAIKVGRVQLWRLGDGE